MCERRLSLGCNNCPYYYNDEFCILEDDYLEDNNIIELEKDNNETIKINRIHKKQ